MRVPFCQQHICPFSVCGHLSVGCAKSHPNLRRVLINLARDSFIYHFIYAKFAFQCRRGASTNILPRKTLAQIDVATFAFSIGSSVDAVTTLLILNIYTMAAARNLIRRRLVYSSDYSIPIIANRSQTMASLNRYKMARQQPNFYGRLNAIIEARNANNKCGGRVEQTPRSNGGRRKKMPTNNINQINKLINRYI